MWWSVTAAMPIIVSSSLRVSTSRSSLESPSATAKNGCGANRSRIKGPISGEVVDEPQREHIQDDLKGLIKGELLFDELSRNLYSTDASIFQVRPLGVAVPRDEE